jgi:hypothetical protein
VERADTAEVRPNKIDAAFARLVMVGNNVVKLYKITELW